MRVLALLLMGCGLLFAALSSAQDGATGLASDDDASGYLSAFKQRALDAALESGARVKGVAYLDEQGRLHERAMFPAPLALHRVTIPQAPITAIAGAALNRNLPADHAMYAATMTHIPRINLV